MYSISTAGVGSGMLATQLFPAIGVESRVPSILVGLIVVLGGYALLHRRVTNEQPA